MPPRTVTLPPGLCICLEPDCVILYGLCHCGCGGKTTIADRSSRKIGWVEGVPTRYIMGHANRQPRIDFTDAAPFKINGVYCKLISLTKGMFAIIDASRYEDVSRLHWTAAKARDRYYAARKAPTKGKRAGKFLYLHRFILGLSIDDPGIGDHINGVTLDCRDKNLRIANEFQNKWNHRVNRENKTGYDGVWFDHSRRKFAASIRIDRKRIFLGRYDSLEEAVIVRRKAEIEHRGEWVRERA